MVYRLRNWQIFRDLMCFNPSIARDIMMRAAEGSKLMAQSVEAAAGILINESVVREIVTTCGCAISQDGLEICILSHRDTLSPAFREEEKENPLFEEYFKNIDTILEDLKQKVARSHII